MTDNVRAAIIGSLVIIFGTWAIEDRRELSRDIAALRTDVTTIQQMLRDHITEHHAQR